MGWDLSAFGATAFKTPALDELANGGVKFSDFHSNGAVCSPTRAALMTGKYQQRTGIDDVVKAKTFRHVGLPLSEVTMAEVFKRAGYQTALFGKWHLGYQDQYNPINQGFDDFIGFVAGNVDYHSHIDLAGKLDWLDGTTIKDQKGYSTDLITENTVAYINHYAKSNSDTGHNKDKPFFIYMAQEAPHGPFQDRTSPIERATTDLRAVEKNQPAGKKASKQEIQQTIYPNMMKAVDEGIAKVLTALRNNNLEENTLIVFMSDNGPTKFGRKGLTGNMAGGKGSIQEGGHRVAAFAYWPAKIKAGQTSSETILGMDLLPTFAALSGTDITDIDNIDGINITNTLINQEKLAPRNTFWKTRHGSAMRSGDWKIINDTKKQAYALYRLDTNGEGERNNLAKIHPEKFQQLKKQLDIWDAEMTAIVTAKKAEIGFDKPIKVTTNR